MSKRNFIFDTNILVHIIRNEDFFINFKKAYNLSNANAIISVVAEGEILSLSSQFNWGKRRNLRLISILSNLIIHPIKN
ncbi:MAG: PIN domain-containing protein [Saprospiraceae bacterium]